MISSSFKGLDVLCYLAKFWWGGLQGWLLWEETGNSLMLENVVSFCQCVFFPCSSARGEQETIMMVLSFLLVLNHHRHSAWQCSFLLCSTFKVRSDHIKLRFVMIAGVGTSSVELIERVLLWKTIFWEGGGVTTWTVEMLWISCVSGDQLLKMASCHEPTEYPHSPESQPYSVLHQSHCGLCTINEYADDTVYPGVWLM